jgi:hypothetical protein
MHLFGLSIEYTKREVIGTSEGGDGGRASFCYRVSGSVRLCFDENSMRIQK